MLGHFNYGEGGATTGSWGGGGDKSMFTPTKRGGESGQVLAMLKGGGTQQRYGVVFSA